ncbi:MAG: DUF3570 domain-containing protein [Spirosomataceae bacterium]
MKKITLAIGFYVSCLFASAQTTKTESSAYENRKLKLDEINLVSSYYNQDGNNSAVTGGIGTEKLFDVANTIDLKISKYDWRKRLHTITADFSIDYYSSASSDKIDPLTVSSASMSDTHIYPSLSWSMKDDETRETFGLNASYSTEWDYKSYGLNANYARQSRDKNREVSLKVGAFFDTWMAILPAELRPDNYSSGAEGDQSNIAYRPRNSYNAALTISQVINKRLQASLTIEPSYQEGLLSTPYHRVYFSNGNVTNERLPGTRAKLPIGMRTSYFLGDKIIIRTFYRYYFDNWGMQAHTANLEVPIKITPFFSVSPFYRFNTQTAIRYFAPYKQNSATSQYYTSDYDVSAFNSHFIGSGIRLAPPKGVLGTKHFNSLEVRYGRYIRSTGLVANSITLAMKFK